MSTGTLMVAIVSVLAPFIIAEFSLSRAQLGSLTSILFLIGALSSPLAGRAVDRLGGRRILILTFVTSACAAVTLASASNYLWVATAMFIGGFALGGANPVTNKLVYNYVVPERRGLTIGVKQAGQPLGTFLGGLLLPLAALHLSWEGAVLSAASLSIVGALVTVKLLPKESRLPARRKRKGFGAPVKWVGTYAFLMGAGMASVSTYLPLYAQERVGLPVAAAGMVASLMGVAGMASRIVWGRTSDRFAHISYPLAIIAGSSIGSILLILTAEHLGPWALWVGAFLYGGTALGWNSVGMLAMVTEMEVSDAGTAAGVVVFAFYGGMILSPVAFGRIVDVTSTYSLGWTFIALLFSIACATAARWWQISRRC